MGKAVTRKRAQGISDGASAPTSCHRGPVPRPPSLISSQGSDMPETYGWLRHVLDEQGISWHRDCDLSDDISIQEHALSAAAPRGFGGRATAPIDLRAALAPTTNPHLAARRVALDLASHIQRALVTQPGFAPQPHVAQLPGAEEPPKAPNRLPVGYDRRHSTGATGSAVLDHHGPRPEPVQTRRRALSAPRSSRGRSRSRIRTGPGCPRRLHDGIGLRLRRAHLGSVSDFLSTHGLADPGCWPYHTDDAA